MGPCSSPTRSSSRPADSDAPKSAPRSAGGVFRGKLADELEREALWLAHQRATVEHALELAPTTEYLDGEAARTLVPALSTRVAGAFYEPDSMELDVAAIHQSFVAELRAHGGTTNTSSHVVALTPGPTWRVTLADGSEVETPIVVNAAGAWGDEVASMAGLAPVPLYPRRRTVAIVGVPDEIDTAAWPLIAFEDGTGDMDGYCKPESGGLLLSPADETPSAACDARPEEIDVARALDGLNHWTTLSARHVKSTWAGLRTFASDRSPVAGFAPDVAGFFWMVGQGGYGIQMAPGLARAATGLIIDDALPLDLAAAGVSRAALAPDRAGLNEPLRSDH